MSSATPLADEDGSWPHGRASNGSWPHGRASNGSSCIRIGGAVEHPGKKTVQLSRNRFRESAELALLPLIGDAERKEVAAEALQRFLSKFLPPQITEHRPRYA